MFHAGTLKYFAQYNAITHYLFKSRRHTHNLAIGYGSFGYEPRVEYLFGIPRYLKEGGAVINVRLAKSIGTYDNGSEERTLVNLQSGIISSVLEHVVPEQMFGADPSNPPDAISAVKALKKASAQGQRIYHITNENRSIALARISHDFATMAEIKSALEVGKEVVTHTDAISVPGWSGAGYIIFDPKTGDGSYKISGGVNGGKVVLVVLIPIFVLSLLFVTVGIPLIMAIAGGSLGWASFSAGTISVNFLISAWLTDSKNLQKFYRKVSSIFSVMSDALTILKPDIAGIILSILGHSLPDE